MKLSDIQGERTIDVIADVIDPICNIAEDKEAAALFRKEKAPEGMEAREFLIKRIRKSAPKLLKRHKKDVVSILSTIKDVSPEEYEKSMNLVSLTKDFIELVTDKAFIELFISAQSGTSSGSAQESTEDQKV